MSESIPKSQGVQGLLTFPGEYTIKIIGQASEDFEATVLGLVRKHLGDLAEAAIRSRASRGRKYLAVSVTVMARDQAQLNAIYQDLSKCDRVLMAL